MRYVPFEEVRREKHVPAQLKRRIEEWIMGVLASRGREHHPPRDYYSLTDEFGIVDVYLQEGLFPLGTDKDKILAKFEKEVLRPARYQIVDSDIRYKMSTRGIGFTIQDLRSRTRMVSKPKYLYHITAKTNERKIMSRGLIPREGPRDRTLRSYLGRIYFTTKYYWEDHHDYVSSMAGALEEEEPYVVIRLDTDKFSKFNLFNDEEVTTGQYVWTPTHIPPHALEVIYTSD